MANELAVTNYNNLRDQLESRKGDFARVIPKHLTPDRLIRVALTAVTRTPLLMQSSTQSLLQSIMIASQLGLELSSGLGLAYLVPYKNKNGKYEAQLIIGYRGMIDLARRGGHISTIEARVVYKGDEFEYNYGDEPKIIHKPAVNGSKLPADVVAVYAVATLSDGSKQFEVMSKAEVDLIKARSRASGAGPWVTDYNEMARKTVVRRLVKYLPMTTDMAKATEIEDANDDGKSYADIIETPGEAPDLPEEPSKAEEIKEAMKAKKEPESVAARLMREGKEAVTSGMKPVAEELENEEPDLAKMTQEAGL